MTTTRSSSPSASSAASNQTVTEGFDQMSTHSEPAVSQSGGESALGSRKNRRTPYAPDYVSADTLARRLDCSKTTVHGYVRRGILPKPVRIGDLVRWRWGDVEKCIELLEAGDDCHANADDPYLAGIEYGSAKEANN